MSAPPPIAAVGVAGGAGRSPAPRAVIALFAVTAWVCALEPPPARAHGEPPEVLSLVERDGDGARIVRLNEGLALRTAQGFRYLCPALWGEDAVAPAHALPDGGVVIGTGSGLWRIAEDGSVEPHPDPAAAGRVIALAASGNELFALRYRGDAYQVLQVHEDRVQVLFGSVSAFDDLAADGEALQLVGLAGGRLHELRLSFAGDVLSENEAGAPPGAVAALARLAGGTGYALVLTSALSAELGRIADGSWRVLASGRLLGGPVETAEGARFVAVDGELARLDGDSLAPFGDAARVTCLRRHFEFPYACSDYGLRALSPDGLGASLFELEDLGPPELARIPAEQRQSCELQWQRYAVDLRAIGITPRAVGGSPDGGASDAGAAGDAAPPPRAGGAGQGTSDGGCSIAAAGGAAGPFGPALVLAAAAVLAFAGSRRQRRR